MKLSIFKLLTCILLASTTILATASTDSVVGNWHGEVQTPSSTLSLVFVIVQDENGKLSAHMEVPAQAPGQKIPISDISVANDHLSMLIAMAGVSIEADWDEENQQWSGTFSESMDVPIVITRGLPDEKPIIEGLDGDWKATINRNGVDLRLILHISTTKYGTSAKVDAPDSMDMNVPVSELTKDGDSIGYKIAAVNGVFAGTLTHADTITGLWTVPNKDDITITFVRSAKTDAPAEHLRPQVPTEPFGYFVEDVTYENAQAKGVTLAGTLTLPEGEGPFPAAILISGSGSQDRNETVFGHQPFLVLADHLTKQGIAVLRYDDRGIAESTGDYYAATSADFATDANAAAAYLMTRSEINHSAIGFVGHSEGGLIAPLAIHDNNTIAYMVMLAGPGTSSLQIARSQNRLLAQSQGTSEEEIAKSEKINTAITKVIAESKTTEEAKTQIRAILTPETMETMSINESQVKMIIAQSTTPWIRYFMGYDPANFVPQITIPILALNGELDMQVPAKENLAGLSNLLKNHPDATITELKGLNHLFQHAKTGAIGEYNDIEETFSPEAMQLIADWINERFNKKN